MNMADYNEMGYFDTVRNNISDEMRIRGRTDKVRNIIFLHKTSYNSDVYGVKGNGGKLLAVAEVAEDGKVDLFI